MKVLTHSFGRLLRNRSQVEKLLLM